MNLNINRRFAVLVSAVLVLFALAGCSSQMPEPKEKIEIKILYNINLKQVKKLVESTYDDIDLQMELALYPSEQLRRLNRGVGPDLVISEQPDSSLVQENLLDISDTKASAAYDGTIMNAWKTDGKAYMIPLPGVYSGYVVNETLFEQAGVDLPENNAELVAALSELKEKGLGVGEDGVSFSIVSDYNTAVGLFYVGNMVPDFLGTVEGVKWLADFRNKQAVFSGVWEQGFALSDALVEAGVMDPADIARQRNTVLCKDRLSNGTLAAAFGNSALYYECIAGNQKAVEEGASREYTYRMLPLFSDEGNEPWFLFYPSALLGINRNISEEKQDACKRILEVLSTTEGQEALIEDMGGGLSCLTGYQQKDNQVPRGVEAYVESGYIYNVLFPNNTVEYLGGYARNIMAGKCSVEEALQSIDQFVHDGTDESSYDFSMIGAVDHDLLLENFNVRLRETELGNFVADCVAEASGAPIAVANGGSIRASLYQGVVYGSDLAVVCPFDSMIIVMEMDGQVLWDMLENSLSSLTDEFPGGRFLSVSGICYTFDSSRPVGSRLVSVTMPDGTALDLAADYQVAVTDYMAGVNSYAEGNGDGFTMLNYYDDTIPKGNVRLVKETGLFYRDALSQYFERYRDSAVDVKLEGRIKDLAQD